MVYQFKVSEGSRVRAQVSKRVGIGLMCRSEVDLGLMCQSEVDLGLMCWREVGLGQVGASEGGRCWGLLEAAAGSRQQPQQTCCLFIPQRPGHPFVRSHLPPFHQK